MKTLWLITARSGSKSVPHKNIRPLGGIPLLGYRALSILKTAPKEDVWISTDSPEYARIAGEFGVTVPFMRPAELASDTAGSADVVLHAMAHADQIGARYDAVAILEPTSPFVRDETLRAAAARLEATPEATAIVATRFVRPHSFFVQPDRPYLDVLAKRFGEKVRRRQDEEEEVTPAGGFYISRWQVFRERRTFYTETTLSYRVSDIEGLEIDEPIDWDWAEFMVASGRVKNS